MAARCKPLTKCLHTHTLYIDYPPRDCSDRDVRLTYRDATGYSGQFEICMDGEWQRTCSSYFTRAVAQTACIQLFGSVPEQTPIYMDQAEVLSETEMSFINPLSCSADSTHLHNCSLSDSGNVALCTPETQPTVRCPGELIGGYTLQLFCMFFTCLNVSPSEGT